MTVVQWLLLPAFAHVALVFIVGTGMGRSRFRSASRGEVKIRDVALDNSRWPDEVRKFANNYQNQFELPVLYYGALALTVATGLADWVAVALSWIFVASRIVHTVIHTGSNVVIRRFQVFVFGFGVIAIMWIWLALRLYVIG